MISKSFAIIICILLVAVTPIYSQSLRTLSECKEVVPVADFDIEAYTTGRWYIHQQAVTRYSPVEQNFCVSALYVLKDRGTFWGYTVSVNNSAQNKDGDIFGGELCAYRTDSNLGKLAVAPCWLPKFFAGPYWVVAYDETEGYALVSGGQPTQPGNNGCRTGTGINNSGLWIFTRSSTRNDDLIAKVRGIAEDAGFDISVLNDVDHTNC